MKKKRLDRYVVGYKAQGNCVYGRETTTFNIQPCRAFTALRKWKKMPCEGATIYELVEVKLFKSLAQRKVG